MSESSNTSANSAQMPQTPRRGWSLRRLVQFRLRTLMLLTVVSAVGVQWWLRPKPTRIELGGGLEAQVQQRMQTVRNASTGKDEEFPVPHGDYRIVDQDGRTLCRGRHLDGEPSGVWTYYHRNGRTSLRGLAERGVARGIWRGWHENGRRQSEIHYGEPAYDLRKSLRLDDDAREHAPRIAVLEGPFRLWHPNGRSLIEGQHVAGERSGTWRTWDDTGRLVEEGTYVEGRRTGLWKTRDGDDAETLREVWHIAGRVLPAPLEPWLGETLASPSMNRRGEALEVAEALGRDDLLLAALDDRSVELRTIAMAALLRRLAAGGATTVRDQLQPRALEWSESRGATEHALGTFVLTLLEPDQRARRLAALFDWAQGDPERQIPVTEALAGLPQVWLEDLQTLVCSDSPGVAALAVDALREALNRAPLRGDPQTMERWRLALEIYQGLKENPQVRQEIRDMADQWGEPYWLNPPGQMGGTFF